MISGYRSRAEQTELYEEAPALAEEEGLSRQEAEQEVKRPSCQVPVSIRQAWRLIRSEPEGQEDGVANKIAEIAPKYGFLFALSRREKRYYWCEFWKIGTIVMLCRVGPIHAKHHLVFRGISGLLKESDR